MKLEDIATTEEEREEWMKNHPHLMPGAEEQQTAAAAPKPAAESVKHESSLESVAVAISAPDIVRIGDYRLTIHSPKMKDLRRFIAKLLSSKTDFMREDRTELSEDDLLDLCQRLMLECAEFEDDSRPADVQAWFDDLEVEAGLPLVLLAKRKINWGSILETVKGLIGKNL